MMKFDLHPTAYQVRFNELCPRHRQKGMCVFLKCQVHLDLTKNRCADRLYSWISNFMTPCSVVYILFHAYRTDRTIKMLARC